MDPGARIKLSGLSRPYSILNAGAECHTNLTDDLRQKDKPGPARTHRINWCHPLIWALIDRICQEVGYPWSPTEIVRRLQIIAPDIFATLRPQRISQWRDHSQPEILKWTDSHLRAISAGTRPFTGERRHGILVSHL